MFKQSDFDGWDMRQLLTDRCDLYSPNAISTLAAKRGSPRAYPSLGTPTYAGVHFHYISTDDFETVALGGQMTESNIMTQDRGIFYVDQQIDVDWFIVMRTIRPDGTQHSEWGHIWEAQGESKDVDSEPFYIDLVNMVKAPQAVDLNWKLIYFKQGAGFSP